jgi:hypothetical protein
MLSQLRAPRPLWATYTIAALFNVAAALIGGKWRFALGFVPGLLFFLTYATVTVTSCLFLTTDLTARRYAIAAGTVYLASTLLGNFAIWAAMQGDHLAPGAFKFTVYTALAYSAANLLGIASVWSYAWHRRPMWAAALVAIPITVAVVLFISYFVLGVGCATMHECP